MQPFSICTIVKNEEKHIVNYLSAIHKYLGSYPHETIIVDTGSDDDTIRLIEDYISKNPNDGIRLEYYVWTDDFAAAKNHAILLARFDWVLVLDADEYITKTDNSCFDRMISRYPGQVGLLKRINLTNINNIDNSTYEHVPRFFNKDLYRYKGIIHEQLYPVLPGNGTETIKHVELPITIDHYGYVGTMDNKKEKVERNNRLLLKMLEDEPDDPYLYFQLGQSYASIHDDENAYKYYSKGLEFDVDERLAYVKQMVVGYGYSMLDTGRFDEALSFEGIYDSFSTSADFLCLMGLIYLRNNMVDRAYSEFEKATHSSECEVAGSNSYIAFYNMAIIDEAMGNTQKAVSLYKKCGDFAPAAERLKEIG